MIIDIQPGWLIISAALIVECLLVTLLILPMPNNDVRGAVTRWVQGLWNVKPIRYGFFAVVVLDVVYFWSVVDALKHPLYEYGFFVAPNHFGVCETRMELSRNERTLATTAFSLFVFLVLFRLIDIQGKLKQQRDRVKELEVMLVPHYPQGMPMGTPIGTPVEYNKKRS